MRRRPVAPQSDGIGGCDASHSECQKRVMKSPHIRGTPSTPGDNLQTMKIRTTALRRSLWRDRFLEIARQVEAIEVRSGAALASGLRPRARMAGFATLPRAQVAR